MIHRLPRDASYCRLACGTDTPHRLGLFATLIKKNLSSMKKSVNHEKICLLKKNCPPPHEEITFVPQIYQLQ